MSIRVASLLPSATEIVCAVEGRDLLVGVSHECDHPEGVDRLPVLTRVRRALPTPSGEIDRSVREILTEALTVYEVEVDRLEELAPDLIVTQDLCDVCAVSLDDVRAALAQLGDTGTRIVSLRPTRLSDVFADVRTVGAALDRPELGERVARALEERCEEIARRARTAGSRPRVLTIEWLDPVMIGGTWMPELVALAGGEALVTAPGDHAPTLSLDELRELDPDVVLLKPCGFGIERSAAELDLLARNLPWDRWSAVSQGRVFLADGNAFFNRPGPRLVESLEILAACVHPEVFADFQQAHVAHVRRVAPDLSLSDVWRASP